LEAGAALQAAAQEIYKVQEGQERSPEQLLDAIREVLQIELGRTAAEKEQQTMSNKSNEDSLGLEPLYAGNFVIGFVDKVNGPGAREVPGTKFSGNKCQRILDWSDWQHRKTLGSIRGASGEPNRRVTGRRCYQGRSRGQEEVCDTCRVPKVGNLLRVPWYGRGRWPVDYANWGVDGRCDNLLISITISSLRPVDALLRGR